MRRFSQSLWFDRMVLLLYRRPQLFVAAIAAVTLLLFHWTSTTTLWRKGAGDNDVYASTPMCDPDTGVCGEDADHPSPRTVYSARSLEQYERWWLMHARLNVTAAQFDAERQSAASSSSLVNPEQGGNTIPLILLGDSITESWIGTNMGERVDRANGVPAILQARFVNNNDGRFHSRPLVLAIAGDQTQHLLYRMQHGELLPQVRSARDAVFVVLIGTNNLGSGVLPGPTADGMQAVAEYLLEETKGRVVLQLLLPRGDNFRTASICPPRCADADLKTPYASFQPAVDQVNVAVRRQKAELQRLHPGRFDVVDCNAPFMDESSGGQGIRVDLMPDKLHPNAAGHELMATCLLDCLQERTCSFA